MALRRVSNPQNPFISEAREWLECEPPDAKLEVYEEHAKSILSENDSPDIPFRWSINPYRGCHHACAYCYARPTHEYLGYGAGTDFDTKIVAKVNAAELLRKAFEKKRWQRESICFSGVTDCYQPQEAVYKLTRGCLEVCLAHRNPVSIITKGYLVIRDTELLAELNRVARASVYVSLAFADDATARLIEPGAPPPSRRLEAIRRLTDAGLRVGVMCAPIIPGLNDTEMPELLRLAAEAGAKSAGYTALHLPGNAASVFIERIKAALPLRAERIENRIREMRNGALNDSRFGNRMRGEGNYWHGIRQLFNLCAVKYGLRSAHRKTGSPPARKTITREPSADLFASLPAPIVKPTNAGRTIQLRLFDE